MPFSLFLMALLMTATLADRSLYFYLNIGRALEALADHRMHDDA